MNNISSDDTIIANAGGNDPQAALTVIRISGTRAHEIVRNCLHRKDRFTAQQPRTIRLYTFIDPQQHTRIDEVTVIPYAHPRSFTGEDMVEMVIHGGVHNCDTVLRALQSAGGRIAMPGEFSRRAVHNEKMSLTKAETIDTLIRSESRAGYTNAQHHLFVDPAQHMTRWKKALLDICAEVESRIEFGHEDDVRQGLHSEEIQNRLYGLSMDMHRQLENRSRIQQVEKGVTVVIAGRKNVGKSTIFNAILGSERAIVHHREGTTRDYISEHVVMDSIPVTLIDTAGVGAAGEEIEGLGIQHARRLIDAADIRVWVTDVVRGGSASEEEEIRSRADTDRDLVVVNKEDTAAAHRVTQWVEQRLGMPHITVSMKRDADRHRLVRYITERCTVTGQHIEPTCIQNARHEELIRRMQQLVHQAYTQYARGEEIVAMYCREALETTNAFSADTIEEDILDTIFSRFCIGK